MAKPAAVDAQVKELKEQIQKLEYEAKQHRKNADIERKTARDKSGQAERAKRRVRELDRSARGPGWPFTR